MDGVAHLVDAVHATSRCGRCTQRVLAMHPIGSGAAPSVGAGGAPQAWMRAKQQVGVGAVSSGWGHSTHSRCGRYSQRVQAEPHPMFACDATSGCGRLTQWLRSAYPVVAVGSPGGCGCHTQWVRAPHPVSGCGRRTQWVQAPHSPGAEAAPGGFGRCTRRNRAQHPAFRRRTRWMRALHPVGFGAVPSGCGPVPSVC